MTWIWMVAFLVPIWCSFHETLVLEPLEGGKAAIWFRFSNSHPNNHGHYSLFPRSAGELLPDTGVYKLNLSISTGAWDGFGHGSLDGNIKPTGTRLMVQYNTDVSWRKVLSRLSTLLGIFLDPSREHWIEPQIVLDPTTRYALFPDQVLSVETLNLWINLLPFQNKLGLASLLNPFQIHRSLYSSASMDLVLESRQGKSVWNLVQTLTVVLDHSLMHRFSISSLFGQTVSKHCPSGSSEIILSVRNLDGFRETDLLVPTTGFVSTTEPTTTTSDQPQYVYSGSQVLMDIGVDLQAPTCRNALPMVYIERYLSRMGPKGTFHMRLKSHVNTTCSVRYLDMFSWKMDILFHTLKFETSRSGIEKEGYRELICIPSTPRGRPAHLECTFELLPNAETHISFEFERSLLECSQYPYDQARGIGMGSGLVLVTDTGSRGASLATNNLLLDLPTPDFSMPFTVLTLSCSCLGIFYTMCFNLLHRQFRQG